MRDRPKEGYAVRLLYIANAPIPTEKAHGVQIMKMCEAFAQSSVETVVITPPLKEWNRSKG